MLRGMDNKVHISTTYLFVVNSLSPDRSERMEGSLDSRAVKRQIYAFTVDFLNHISLEDGMDGAEDN
jgi:hypothetical protein